MTMTRIAIDNGTWFDPSKATSWREGQRHDGHNWISLATGDQWLHETLYRTAKGSWVVRHESDWQGSLDRWELISEEEALH